MLFSMSYARYYAAIKTQNRLPMRKYADVFTLVAAILALSGCNALNNYTQEEQVTNMSTYGAGPNYRIAFNNQGWTKDSVESDSSGYTMMYRPTNQSGIEPQAIRLMYGRGITTSLQEAVQEAATAMAQSSCQTNTYRILQQSSQSIVFTTKMANCSSGNGMYTYRKIFNTKDGQYSITYVAAPGEVSGSAMSQGRQIVDAASLKTYWSTVHL